LKDVASVWYFSAILKAFFKSKNKVRSTMRKFEPIFLRKSRKLIWTPPPLKLWRTGRRGKLFFWGKGIALPRLSSRPHSSPDPSCGRVFESFLFRFRISYFAKQNAPPKKLLPLTRPTHSRATLRNSLKFFFD